MSGMVEKSDVQDSIVKGLITVIVPVYNGERFLAQTLDSIRAQTYPDWECFVVDDGSTDATADIVRTFEVRDKRFRLVSADHGGVSRARNRGLDLACGEFVHFMDGDDLLAPDAYRLLVNALVAHPRAGVAHGRCDLIDGEGSTIGQASELVETDDYLLLLLVQNPFSINSMMLRGECIGSLRFDTQLVIGEDWDMWIQLLLSGVLFHSVDAVVGHCRRHSDNATGSMQRFLQDTTTVIDRYHERQRKRLPPRCRHLRSTAIMYNWMRICWRAEVCRDVQSQSKATKGFIKSVLLLPVTRVNIWYFSRYWSFARGHHPFPTKLACVLSPVFPAWVLWRFRNSLAGARRL